jgi:hypothetical protein
MRTKFNTGHHAVVYDADRSLGVTRTYDLRMVRIVQMNDANKLYESG